MKQNPLLVAVLALAVLGGFVYYTRENPPEPESDAVPLVRVEVDTIQRVTVAKATGETVVVERTADTPWAFGAGVSVPADDDAIDLMVSNLASLDAARVVQEETTDWGIYGLEGGQLTVTMNTVDGLPTSITFGDATPTGTSVYVRLADDPRLFTTFSYARDNFDKTVFDWRDKRLVRVDEDSTASLSVEVGTRKLEFEKDLLNWSITAPLAVRADRRIVGDLMREISSVQMSSVLSETDGDAAAEYSNARQFAVAVITDGAGTHELTVSEGGSSGYFGTSSDLPGGVYELPATFAASLDRELDAFREHDLFDFGFGDLSHLEFRDGSILARIEKRGTEWVLTTEGDRTLPAENVQTLIDALRGLSAIGFPSDDAGDQTRYGLDRPGVEIETAIALADLAPEKVLICNPANGRVYAARAGESSTYEIEVAAVEQLRQAMSSVLASESESEE